MSTFASRVQKTVPLPDDPPHTVTIQKLRRSQLREAEDNNMSAFVKKVRAQFGEKVVDDLMAETAQKSIAGRVR